jgi:hypothetical protein
MSILVDESRRMMPTFNPTAESHKIQNDMCKAGTWLGSMPANTIVQSDPQQSIKNLQAGVLPEYRRLAAKLIEHFIESFKAQGGDDAKLREHFERMYKWTQ